MTRRRELPALVLASGSPRRRELLRGLGVRFSIRPSEVDESLRDVIAFPKTQRGQDALMESPSEVELAQLVELGLRLRRRGS